MVVAETPTLTIQGHWANQWEYNFALALDHYKIDYQFQYLIGIAGARGSMRVDFIVWRTPRYPFPTPVEIQGEYWHTGTRSSEDQLKLDLLRQMFGGVVVEIWDELDTLDKAKQAVRKYIL